MQLRVAPESNSALTLLSPTAVLYVEVWVSLICINSISAVPLVRWLLSGSFWVVSRPD